MSRSFEDMRDCVKDAIEKGSKRGGEFKTMRHAIIAEMKRLGFSLSEIKDKLLEWNQRNEKPLSSMEQKRQLLDYVEWTEKNSCKTGCRALEEYCLGQDSCSFHKKKMCFNRKATESLPFDLNAARKYLEDRYKADGYINSFILKNLRRIQVEKGTGEVILVGYRGIATAIRENDGHIISPMTIFRRIQDLISEGMIEIVEKGKRGTFTSKANGYRFIPWKNPTITHNNSYV